MVAGADDRASEKHRAPLGEHTQKLDTIKPRRARHG